MSEQAPIDLHYTFRIRIARTNVAGTCLWCGRKLRAFRYPDIRDGRGDYADNAVCGLRCGYMFGVTAAKLGFRLNPREDKP